MRVEDISFLDLCGVRGYLFYLEESIDWVTHQGAGCAKAKSKILLLFAFFFTTVTPRGLS